MAAKTLFTIIHAEHDLRIGALPASGPAAALMIGAHGLKKVFLVMMFVSRQPDFAALGHGEVIQHRQHGL